MSNVERPLDSVVSRTVLVFPPELVQGRQCSCRFEPDGIALIKGYLKKRGYDAVDLVYSPPCLPHTKVGDGHQGWGISPFDQEGHSFRGVVTAASVVDLESTTACVLRDMLPLAVMSRATLIGMSVGFPSQLYHAIILARVIKRLYPHIFIVFGGPLITSYVTLVVTIPELASTVDGIVAGFGEEPIAQLLLCLEEGGDRSKVPNLYVSRGNSFSLNRVVWSPDGETLRTVPDYGRPELRRQRDPSFPLRPSVGCYWGKCAFCIYPSMSTGRAGEHRCVVLRPEDLVGHIHALMGAGAGCHFELCSDSLPPHYLRAFAEHVIRTGLKIRWSAWSCVDRRFADHGVLDTMVKSGCESILLGLESASPRVLRRMNKMQTREDIDTVLRAFRSAHIRSFLTLCMGFPGETFDEAMETVEYVRCLIADGAITSGSEIRMYRFALMANTPIAADFRQYGIAAVDWSDMYYLDDDYTYRYTVTEGMTFDQVREFVATHRSRLGIDISDCPGS